MLTHGFFFFLRKQRFIGVPLEGDRMAGSYTKEHCAYLFSY